MISFRNLSLLIALALVALVNVLGCASTSDKQSTHLVLPPPTPKKFVTESKHYLSQPNLVKATFTQPPIFWNGKSEGYSRLAFAISPNAKYPEKAKQLAGDLINSLNQSGWYIIEDYTHPPKSKDAILAQLRQSNNAEILVYMTGAESSVYEYNWTGTCYNTVTTHDHHGHEQTYDEPYSCNKAENQTNSRADLDFYRVSDGAIVASRYYTRYREYPWQWSDEKCLEYIHKLLIEFLTECITPQPTEIDLDIGKILSISARHGADLVNNDFIGTDIIKFVINLPKELRGLKIMLFVNGTQNNTDVPTVLEQFEWAENSTNKVFTYQAQDLVLKSNGSTRFDVSLFIEDNNIRSETIRITPSQPQVLNNGVNPNQIIVPEDPTTSTVPALNATSVSESTSTGSESSEPTKDESVNKNKSKNNANTIWTVPEL